MSTSVPPHQQPCPADGTDPVSRPTTERPRRRRLPSWYTTPQPAPTPPRECTRPGPCRSYKAGHLLHFIHAGFIRRTPWGWRDGVVRTLAEDNVALVDYLDGSGTAEIWQHHDLSIVAPAGSPVRLHERYHALEAGDEVLNVLLLRGVGPVPEPEAPELWAGEGDLIFVDIATGRGRRAPRR